MFEASLTHMITCLPNVYRNAIPILVSTKINDLPSQLVLGDGRWMFFRRQALRSPRFSSVLNMFIV